MHVASRERYEMNILFSLKQETHLSQTLRDASCHCHSRSVNVIRNETLEYGSPELHCNYVCISYRFWDIHRDLEISVRGSLKVIQNGTIPKLGYGFLFALHTIYGSILYHFRDNVRYRYWSKSRFFHTLLHLTTQIGGSCRNVAMLLGIEKLEWCGYQKVKKVSRSPFSWNTSGIVSRGKNGPTYSTCLTC